MTSRGKKASVLEDETAGEILIAWQHFTAGTSDELSLREGDLVELLDTQDPAAPLRKKAKMDPELDKLQATDLLDSAAAKHKLSVKPKRTHSSSRMSPTQLGMNRWLVRQVGGEQKQGWVPCGILQTVDEPTPDTGPGDAAYRREAVVRELVETEQEFVRDLQHVVQCYLVKSDSSKVPRVVKDNHHGIFNNLKQIADFHRSVLMEGVKYYAAEPFMLGKVFLRLERDFDKHVAYCCEEPQAQAFLDTCDEARDYFEELSHRLGDDKSISEHLKLPIQRINDYQLLLKELVRYSVCLGEDSSDLQRALEFMLSIPHRAQDDKFTSSIEGYRGNIHKLGRLLTHDWFSITTASTTKERYLFLFKARILVTKVRRISDDRSVFQLKDIIRLPEFEVRDRLEDGKTFELHNTVSPAQIVLCAHRDHIKQFWLKEIRQYSNDIVALEEHAADDLQIDSGATSPAEPAQSVAEKPLPDLGQKVAESHKVQQKVTESVDSVKAPESVPEPPKSAPIPVVATKPLETVTPVAIKDTSEIKDTKPPVVEAPKPKIEEKPVPSKTPVVEPPKPKPEEKKPVPSKQPVEPEVKKPSEPKIEPKKDSAKQPEVKQPPQKASEYSNPPPKAFSNPAKAPAPEPNPPPQTVKEPAPAVTSVAATAAATVTTSTATAAASVKVSETSSTLSTTATKKVEVASATKSETVAEKKDVSVAEVKAASQSQSVASQEVQKKVETTSNEMSQRSARAESSYSSSRRTVTSSSYGGEEVSASSYRSESLIGAEDFSGSSRTSRRYVTQSSLTGGVDDLLLNGGGAGSLTEISKITKVVTESTIIDDGSAAEESRLVTRAVKETAKVDGKIVSETAETTYECTDDGSAKMPLKNEEKVGKPAFTRTLNSTSVEPGKTAVLEIGLTDEPEGVTWLKNNHALKQDDDRISSSATDGNKTFKLEIKNCQKTDTGLYTAVASNYAGKTICTAQIVVHESSSVSDDQKPEFIVQLKDTEVIEEAFLRFMVKVKGKPKIEFFKDGIQILEGHTDRMRIVTDGADRGFYELLIPDVRKQDAGIYRCVADNKYGEVSSEAKVTVTTCKNIFADLGEGTLAPGEKPKFMWRRDGLPFEPEERFKVLLGDDEDSLALVFQHVRPEDAGLYTCVAQTSSGHISCSAELTVQGAINQLMREPEKPRLIIETKDATVSQGGSAMLELQMKGFPKPIVTWTHDGKPIEPSGKYKFLYEDEEGMSLVIKNVTPQDAGTYQVQAKNELGSDSAEITLNVKAPPKIKAKIQDQAISIDETLKINIEIEGIPKPTVKLFKDGKEISQCERIRVVEGEWANYSVVINNTSFHDAGSYSIVATNELAQASDYWKLDLFSAPKWEKKLGSDVQVKEDKDQQFSIKLVADPAPEVTWYKDDKEITSDSHYVISKDNDEYMLKITGAVSTDGGNYKVKAKNIHGTVEDTVNVVVRRSPKVTMALHDMTVTENDKNVEFLVHVDAFPKPTIKWYLDEKEITKTEYTKIESDDGLKLIIKEVNTEHAGLYSCKITNEEGSSETCSKLTVLCKPRITKQLKDVTINEGTKLKLEVEIESVPDPTVKWLHNGCDVSADARIKITRNTQRQESYNLEVDLIKYEDRGEYEVVVTNALGTVRSKSTVTVQKVAHSEGETVDESQTIKIKTSTDETAAKKAVSAEVVDIEEKEIDASKKPVEEEELKPSKAKKGINAEKIDIEEKETDEKPDKAAEKELEQEERKNAISAEKQEVDVFENEPDVPKKLEEEEIKKNKLQKGISLQKEEIEVVDAEKPETKVPKEEEASKKKLQKARSLQQGDIEMKDAEDANESKGTLQESEAEKKKLQKAMSLQKGDIQYKESDESQAKTAEEKMLQRQESKKGVKEPDEEIDEAMEDLLRRAKKQRSIVEEISSNESEVTEQAFPKILYSNVADHTRPASLDVSYSVKAVGTPEPDVTWILEGKEVKPDGKRLVVTKKGNETKLDITKIAPEDNGTWQCKVSNVMGEEVLSAKLTVTPEKELRKPKLKQGLVDQTIKKTKECKFSATVVGDPVPDVTWCHDGEPISVKDYEMYNILQHSDTEDIEDGLKVCTYTLTIPSCERVNAGKYTMKAKNKWDELETSATLDVVYKPEMSGTHDATAVPGEEVEFQCQVVSNPQCKVKWVKDGKAVENGVFYEITEDVANGVYKLHIKSVNMVDEGFYECVASNSEGETVHKTELRTNTIKPKFITPLAELSVEHHSGLCVRTRAVGLPKPEISWLRNRQLLVLDTNHTVETESEGQIISTLSINNFDLVDIGDYTCVAANVAGDAETTARISMLQLPPGFAIKLERSLDVGEGETLELKAKVSGSPRPDVLWFKDGEPIPLNDKRVKREVLPDGTVKLTIENVKPEDSGAYRIELKNANGQNNGLCAVAVTQTPRTPKFLKELEDAHATVGQPLRLEAIVSAYPPPDIKWMKDGLPMRSVPNARVENHPNGTIALVIDCVKPENAGTYTVTVSNKLGERIGTSNVEIEKRPSKPHFIVPLKPQSVVENFPVKMEVKVMGHPLPQLTWSRNGNDVVSDKKHVTIHDYPDGTGTLVLNACDNRDAMLYKVTAKNENGEAVSEAALEVIPAAKNAEPEERPLFLHALRDVITEEGSALHMETPFSGNPIPSVAWTKDGVPLEPSDRVLLTCDGHKVGVSIDEAIPSDAGVYRCTLSNPLGTETSEGKAIVHKIFSTPSFLQKFSDLQQLPSRDAKFPARVTGVPKPDIIWTKNDVPLHDSSKYRIKRDGEVCCLYVVDCQPDDKGVYKCTARNKEGEASCEAKLDVVDEIKSPKKTESPTFLKRIGDTELYPGMTAKFTACCSGTPEPVVEWFRDDVKLFPSDRIRMEMDRNGLLRLTIAGADEADIGKYSCKISNPYGSDICHANLKFDETDSKKRPIGDQYVDYEKYKKSGAPMPLSDCPIISRMTDRHCTLSWKPSIPTGPRTPVTYLLEMCELPLGDWFTVRSGIRSCVCEVRNLEPFRDYKFRVRVENMYGISDPSPYAITHREKLEPDAPKFVPYLQPGIDFRPETSPYFPKDFDIERPPHGNMSQAPRFLRQEHDTQYGVKDQSCNLFWFVYGYPKPRMSYFFNDQPIETGGRFDTSYTRNGQATIFINKMLDRDVGVYEAVASNEHGEARQRVHLEIAELPTFITRPEINYVMMRNRAHFEARVAGVPYPEVKWYKDWLPLACSSRTKMYFQEPDKFVLTIADCISKDEGLYSCSARNVAGCVSSSAMLHVEENDLDFNYYTYGNISPLKPKRRLLDDAYDLGDELGRGTQGITYHAVERINGRNYAAKVMHGKSDFRPFMHNELDALNSLHHRKLIQLHDVYETDNSMGLILELGGGGELVRDNLLKLDYYTESDIAVYIRQILLGLQHMHEHGFGHMGLNIGDLLISHPGGDDLKISDFGLARRISMGKWYSLLYGMPEYVSPETANGEGVGFGQDIWSVGIITYILLSGQSPFRGKDDRETLTRIQSGKWTFDEEYWCHMSLEARDFIKKLLVYQAEGRLDVRQALRHPWLERADKKYSDDYRISTRYLRDYYELYKEWYDNASCRRWYRRRPLSGAFTHPSRMVYPPGESWTPPPTPERTPIKKPGSWEDQVPTRSPLNYEIGVIKSESHYQNGPDTYLLQLRDVGFPCRLRQYMKVAANRGAGRACILSDENGYDWRTPSIHERRRFTDIMDEEIDDERKERISKYGTADAATVRRLRHEIGPRLDSYAEAEALIESKQTGQLPFFREKPQMIAMVDGKDCELTCLAVGDPQPFVQWYKNDAIIAESSRVKIEVDSDGRSHLRLCPALRFDQGFYKVVARNKIGQTITRTRIVDGAVPDSPDSPEAIQVSDSQVLLNWKQPKHDGQSPVLCYSLQYKLCDDVAWTECANKNIDHEFYLVSNLQPQKGYQFRLAARNAIGWSEEGVPTSVVSTKAAGATKVSISRAMLHLQQMTDGGQEINPETRTKLEYSAEQKPVEWTDAKVEDNYNFISEISRGRFATIVKAVDKRSDNVVIVKLMDLAGNEDHVNGEFAAYRSLRHERIAQLLEAYRNHDNPMAVFVMEKLQGADILSYLASRHEYTEQTVATVVSQILDGLQYLHWRGLCHLDIQPDNVVMVGIRSIQVKLVDLGCAHRVSKLGTIVPTVGHPDYISPEVLNEEHAFPQSDIWSLGVLTYFMLSGTVPFRGENSDESRQNILFVRYRFEHLYKELTPEAVRFLMLVFKRNPNKRPTTEECHENRWLMPTDSMIKKRERAVFLGNRLKEYSELYHAERSQAAQDSQAVGKTSIKTTLLRSQSIQEELLTTP